MPEYFIAIAKQTLFLTLVLTGPPIIAAMIVGLVISILQATTQVQEQTLTFVPKLVSIVVVLGVIGPWMLSQLVSFTTSIFESFPSYVH